VPQQFSKDVSLGNSYLRYYSEQCINALHSNGINDIVSTHVDIVGIIERLREPDLTRESLKDHLREKFPNLPPDNSEALICETINLAVKLWLMIDVGELFDGFVPGQKSLSWERGVLKDLLVNYFSPPITMPMSRKGQTRQDIYSSKSRAYRRSPNHLDEQYFKPLATNG
jgi:hypothetical protein